MGAAVKAWTKILFSIDWFGNSLISLVLIFGGVRLGVVVLT